MKKHQQEHQMKHLLKVKIDAENINHDHLSNFLFSNKINELSIFNLKEKISLSK
jgi:hypothetical protein